MKYRGYTITYNPPPIPVRSFDYEWVHDDYDGADDGNDQRYGHSESIEAAKAAIDEQIEEME